MALVYLSFLDHTQKHTSSIAHQMHSLSTKLIIPTIQQGKIVLCQILKTNYHSFLSLSNYYLVTGCCDLFSEI